MLVSGLCLCKWCVCVLRVWVCVCDVCDPFVSACVCIHMERVSGACVCCVCGSLCACVVLV